MKEYDFKKLYNGESCHAGMKVAPWVIEDRKVAIEIGVKAEYMETYHLPNGKKYLVTFVEVPEEKFESYIKDYNRQIRDFFASGYKEFCSTSSKRRNENGVNGVKAENEESGWSKGRRKGMISLEEMMEMGYEPSEEGWLDTELLYEQLLEAAGKLKDYYPEIIKRKRNGDTPKEIIKDLPVGKSKGYMELKAVEEFVREFLK